MKSLKQKVTKQLQCKLSEAEVLAFGRELAGAHAEKNRVQAQLDAVKADYKGKIEEQLGRISSLSAKVHSGIETRDVECVMEKNFETGRVTVVRLDCGKIIEDRPMREDEKQMELQ